MRIASARGSVKPSHSCPWLVRPVRALLRRARNSIRCILQIIYTQAVLMRRHALARLPRCERPDARAETATRSAASIVTPRKQTSNICMCHGTGSGGGRTEQLRVTLRESCPQRAALFQSFLQVGFQLVSPLIADFQLVAKLNRRLMIERTRGRPTGALEVCRRCFRTRAARGHSAEPSVDPRL